MRYEYRTYGNFPCRKMDLEAIGGYKDIVLIADPHGSFVKEGNKYIEIHVFAPRITEDEAIKQIAKALNVKQSQILLF